MKIKNTNTLAVILENRFELAIKLMENGTTEKRVAKYELKLAKRLRKKAKMDMKALVRLERLVVGYEKHVGL